MPTISESARIDRSRIGRGAYGIATPIVHAGGGVTMNSPPEESPTSPFFRSSLPPMAASYDLYHRQFRTTTILTTTRTLPVNL